MLRYVAGRLLSRHLSHVPLLCRGAQTGRETSRACPERELWVELTRTRVSGAAALLSTWMAWLCKSLMEPRPASQRLQHK